VALHSFPSPCVTFTHNASTSTIVDADALWVNVTQVSWQLWMEVLDI